MWSDCNGPDLDIYPPIAVRGRVGGKGAAWEGAEGAQEAHSV